MIIYILKSVLLGSGVGDRCKHDKDGDGVTHDDVCPYNRFIQTTNFTDNSIILLGNMGRDAQRSPKWTIRDKVCIYWLNLTFLVNMQISYSYTTWLWRILCDHRYHVVIEIISWLQNTESYEKWQNDVFYNLFEFPLQETTSFFIGRNCKCS